MDEEAKAERVVGNPACRSGFPPPKPMLRTAITRINMAPNSGVAGPMVLNLGCREEYERYKQSQGPNSEQLRQNLWSGALASVLLRSSPGYFHV